MNIRVLIVDDEAFVRDSLQEFLENCGYHSFAVGSAEEALDFFKIHTAHIMIVDIMLPGMNGLELTEIVKKKYEADIIVITGYSENYSYEEAIAKGASDFVFKPLRYNELLLRLKRVLNERQLSEERKQMMDELKKLAITDGLTNLYNSRQFYRQLELEINRSNRYMHPLSLLLLDIDRFKQYNDTFGHIEGDKVLVRIGRTISMCLRKMDTAYRYGGEEFTVILPETSCDEAITVGQRIRSSIEEETFNHPNGHSSTITISIGATQYRPKEELTALIQRADKAMYLSKEKGRNDVSAL